MTGWLSAVLRGVSLGLAAAMPIGPVNVQIARRALRSGFRAGAAVGAGAVTVDVFYAILSSFSFTHWLNRPAVILPVSVIGVLFLGYLGVLSLRGARHTWRHDPLAIAAEPDRSSSEAVVVPPAAGPEKQSGLGAWSGYRVGLLMTLFNPMTLVFWFSVIPTTGLLGRTDPVPDPAAAARTVEAPVTAEARTPTRPAAAETRQLPMMAFGVFIGTLAWVVGFCTLLQLMRRAFTSRPVARQRTLAVVDAIGGVALLIFALASAIAFVQLVRPLL